MAMPSDQLSLFNYLDRFPELVCTQHHDPRQVGPVRVKVRKGVLKLLRNYAHPVLLFLEGAALHFEEAGFVVKLGEQVMGFRYGP